MLTTVSRSPLHLPPGPVRLPSRLQPVKLLASQHDVRAWPGGVGNAKVGGNYAPSIKVRMKTSFSYLVFVTSDRIPARKGRNTTSRKNICWAIARRRRLYAAFQTRRLQLISRPLSNDAFAGANGSGV